MPEDIKPKVDELAQLVEEKLGIPKQEVLDQWEQELETVKTLRSDLAKDDVARRAFVRLRGHWKKELRSPALFYEGMIIRVAQPFDVLRSMHTAAQLIYEKDPQKAVAEGWTDDQGHALDNRRKFKSGKPNQDFGKQLPATRHIQNIAGIAKTNDMAAPQVFRMILSERLAGQVNIPLFTPVKFRANVAKTQPTDGTMALNEYSGLRFTVAAITGFPEPEELLKQFFGEHLVAPEDLPNWHKENENNPQRFALVEGYVDDVDPSANPSTGNARVVMIDDAGDVEIVGWVPAHLRPLIDFGPSSRVILGGRTTQNMFNDEERTMLNCESLYAPPKDKIPLEETPESVVSGAEEVS